MSVSEPLVSIIVASYNGEIKETIKSIVNQDYPNIQLIIADDASASFDEDAIRAIVIKGNINELVIHRNPSNLGTVKNLNGVLHFVKGEYLELIGQGDCLRHERVVSEYVNLMDTEQCDIICANCCYEHVKEPVWSERFVSKLQKMNNHQLYKELLIHCFILAPAIFAKSSIYTTQHFDESYRLCEDWPKWLKLTKEGYCFFFTNKIMISYSDTGVSLKGKQTKSAEMLRQDIEEIYKNMVFPNLYNLSLFQRRELVYYYNKRVIWIRLTRLQKACIFIRYFDVIIITVLLKHKIMRLCCR